MLQKWAWTYWGFSTPSILLRTAWFHSHFTHPVRFNISDSNYPLHAWPKPRRATCLQATPSSTIASNTIDVVQNNSNFGAALSYITSIATSDFIQSVFGGANQMVQRHSKLLIMKWLCISPVAAMINFGTVNLQLQSALTLFQSEAHFMSSETAIGVGNTITETVSSSCNFPCTSWQISIQTPHASSLSTEPFIIMETTNSTASNPVTSSLAVSNIGSTQATDDCSGVSTKNSPINSALLTLSSFDFDANAIILSFLQSLFHIQWTSLPFVNRPDAVCQLQHSRSASFPDRDEQRLPRPNSPLYKPCQDSFWWLRLLVQHNLNYMV